jgi:predicted MFS family arabinose efflux permease
MGLVLTAQLLFGLGWSAYLVQPKFLATKFGADAATISHVTVMSPVAAVAMLPLAVSIMDRVSRVWIFRAGLALLFTASLGYLWVDHIGPALFLLQATIGASYVLSYNASASIIADEAPPERLGEAIGLLGASNVVTNAIATTIAEHLAASHGWGATFRMSAGLALVAFALSTRLSEGPKATRARPSAPLAASLRGPLGVVLLVSALAGAAFSAMFTFHQPYVLSLGGKSVSPFFVGFTVTAVAARVVFGSLGDRLGHRQVSLAAMIAYGTVALATARLQVSHLWAYGLAFGAAHGVLYPTLNTHGVHAAPGAARGRVITLYGGAFNVGVALATLAWGQVAGAFGFPAVFAGAALVAYAGAGVLATDAARGRGGRPSFGLVPPSER